ncbi:hypothetical protein OHC33_009437 [Knufia fluminis]|uniref:Uncharacterized protein n=1 Tax=Knufia fluminis TaxID=191047 RepID=A0AAN8I462_9EURO|nr:hypothetical protein OHC33_009437 [Knufia fluminis]
MLELAATEMNLAEAEEEVVRVDETIAHLDDVSSRILKREMQALSVFDSLPNKQEIALSNQDFMWNSAPLVQ